VEKGKNITNISLSELRKLRSEGKLNSDLARLRAKSEDELEKDILSDRDGNVSIDWINSGVIAHRKNKERITIRIDKEVLDFFKDLGEGYQTKINDVLNLYVSSVKS